MAINVLNTSTLSEALAADTNDFTVGATTNISVGQLLLIQGTGGFEAVKVQEIPVSGRVKVLRGVGGTRARAHKSGARFFIGDADDFASARNAARGAIDGLVGANGDFPEYVFPGLRARDGIGNEYVLVELTATSYSGVTVLISTDGLFTAAPLVAGRQGSVGLLVEPGTSDQLVWAQIYGYNSFAQDGLGDSSGTSTRLALAASTVNTPDTGMVATSRSSHSSVVGTAQDVIHGMFIVGEASTATTSATSCSGVAYPVWLNYPFVKMYGEVTKNTSTD